ncbi:MAG: MarR family transcriptional regulator [Bacteroidales bacterium]|nr:MarR family transcriptional regulator [Bacteroidales bacterium]
MIQIVSPTYHISHTASILETALKKRLQASGLGITPEQLGMLRLLYAQSETVSMNFISDHTFRDHSSVTRIISTLEKNEFVMRTDSDSDKRKQCIGISETGRQIFLKASKVAELHVKQAMKGISSKDQKAIVNAMNLINENLK